MQQQICDIVQYNEGAVNLHELLENLRIIILGPEKMEVYDTFMKKLSGDIIAYTRRCPGNPISSIKRICELVQRQTRIFLILIGRQFTTDPEQALIHFLKISKILTAFDGSVESLNDSEIKSKMQLYLGRVWLWIASSVYIEPVIGHITKKKILSIIAPCRPLHNFCYKIEQKLIRSKLKQLVKRKNKFTEDDSVMFSYAIMLAACSNDHKHQRHASKRILAELHKFPEIQSRNRYLIWLVQGYMKYQTQIKIDENVIGFVDKCIMPPDLIICMMKTKKHTVEDPLFGQKQIRHYRFLQGMTNAVYGLYSHQDQTKLRVLHDTTQHNLKTLITLTFEEFKKVEIEIIDRLLMFCRTGSITRLTLSVLHDHVDNVISYIFFVFFTCSVHQHQVAFPPVKALGEKVLADFAYLEKSLESARNTTEKIDWSVRVKSQESFFLMSFLMFCLSLGDGAHKLDCCSESNCLGTLHPGSYDAHLECLGKELVGSDVFKNLSMNIDHSDQLGSLGEIIPSVIFTSRVIYRICYYDIHLVADVDVEGPLDDKGNPPLIEKRVMHTGVDETGLTRNCIQACIDEFLAKPYVKHDDDGKIFFDFDGLTNIDAKREGYNFGSFLVFLYSSGYDCHLPIKEETIATFTKRGDWIFTVDGGYYSLPTGTMDTLNLMEKAAKNQDEYQQMIDTQLEQMDYCRKQYILKSREFCQVVGYVLRRSNCDVMSHFNSDQLIKKLHAPLQIDADTIINSMSLKSFVDISDEDSVIALEKFQMLKELFRELTNEKKIQFVKLVKGNLADKSDIVVFFDKTNVIPEWQSCQKIIKIGNGLCKKWLDFSIENAIGFHKV